MARFRAISSDSRECAAVALPATVEDKRLPPATKPAGYRATLKPSHSKIEPSRNRAVAVPSAIPSVITPGDQRKCELSNWIRIQLIISSQRPSSTSSVALREQQPCRFLRDSPPKSSHVCLPKIQNRFILVMCTTAQSNIFDRVLLAASPGNPMMEFNGLARSTASA